MENREFTKTNTDTTISKGELFNIIENISRPAYQLFLHYHNETLKKFRKIATDHIEELHAAYFDQVRAAEANAISACREEFSEKLLQWEIERKELEDRVNGILDREERCSTIEHEARGKENECLHNRTLTEHSQ